MRFVIRSNTMIIHKACQTILILLNKVGIIKQWMYSCNNEPRAYVEWELLLKLRSRKIHFYVTSQKLAAKIPAHHSPGYPLGYEDGYEDCQSIHDSK